MTRRTLMDLYTASQKIDKLLNPSHKFFSTYIKKNTQNFELYKEGWLLVAFPKKYPKFTLTRKKNTINTNQPYIMQFIEDFDLVDTQEELENKGYEDIRVYSINALATLI